MIFAVLLVCGKAQADSVPLIYEKGTYLVPVFINERISLNFTVDSGASDVVIPADVFSTLVRTGTILKSDFVDTQAYELADGSQLTSKRFRIRSLRVGDVELRNVIASVGPPEGNLLLGQSFLSRMKTWAIDNERRLLVFNELPTYRSAQTSAANGEHRAWPPTTMGAEITSSMGDTDVPLTPEEIRRHCASAQFRDTGPWPYKQQRAADYYPDASKRAEEEGRVIVKFTLANDGRPITESIQVNTSSGFPRLDEAAIRMVTEETFFPGCSDGKPAASTSTQPIAFYLTHK